MGFFTFFVSLREGIGHGSCSGRQRHGQKDKDEDKDWDVDRDEDEDEDKDKDKDKDNKGWRNERTIPVPSVSRCIRNPSEFRH